MALAETSAQKLIYEGRGTGVSPRVIELFLPEETDNLKKPDTGWPAVLHIRARGGKEAAQLDTLAQAILKEGFAYADVRPDNIKLNPSLKAASRYMLANAKDLDIDAASIFVLGVGDGAGVAAKLAFTAKQPIDNGYGQSGSEPIDFAGLIVIDGVFNHVDAEHQGAEFLTNDPEFGAAAIIGGNPKASPALLAKQRDRSAVSFLDPTAPPTLVVRTPYDPLIDQSIDLRMLLHVNQVAAEYVETDLLSEVIAFLKRPGPDPDVVLSQVTFRDYTLLHAKRGEWTDEKFKYLVLVEESNKILLGGDYVGAGKHLIEVPRELRRTAAHNEVFAQRMRWLMRDKAHRTEFPKNLVVPSWAADVGNDLYGVYADVDVAGQRLRLRWCEPGELKVLYEEAMRPVTESWHAGTYSITDGFWMLEHEVTQELYAAVTRQKPSGFLGPGFPVERVTKIEAEAFCAQLNRIVPGLGARLPSAYEWHYACMAGYAWAKNRMRGGVGEVMRHFAGTRNPDHMGWFWDNSNRQAHAVKQKLPNAWGLYDMHGNVSEWTSTPLDPKVKPADAKYFIAKGGSWTSWDGACRAGAIDANPPDRRTYYLGFRFVCDAVRPAED